MGTRAATGARSAVRSRGGAATAPTAVADIARAMAPTARQHRARTRSTGGPPASGPASNAPGGPSGTWWLRPDPGTWGDRGTDRRVRPTGRPSRGRQDPVKVPSGLVGRPGDGPSGEWRSRKSDRRAGACAARAVSRQPALPDGDQERAGASSPQTTRAFIRASPFQQAGSPRRVPGQVASGSTRSARSTTRHGCLRPGQTRERRRGPPKLTPDDASSFNRADASCRREAPASRAKRSAVVSKATNLDCRRRRTGGASRTMRSHASTNAARRGARVPAWWSSCSSTARSSSAVRASMAPLVTYTVGRRMPATNACRLRSWMTWHGTPAISSTRLLADDARARAVEPSANAMAVAPQTQRTRVPAASMAKSGSAWLASETRKHPKPAPSINRTVPRLDVTRRHPLRCRGAAGGARGPRPSAGWRTGDRQSPRIGR